jgi:glycosyltransferase involved in cell wall biosynthesis
MRVLIVEEALQKHQGHWVSYIGGIASELRKMGDTVDVLVHKDAEDDVIHEVGGTRWLRRSVWTDPRSTGTVGGLIHNWMLYRDLAGFLDRNPPYDMVLALTMRVQHVLAFAHLARSTRGGRCGRIVLLFLAGFSIYEGPGRAPRIPANGAVLTFRLGVAHMRSAIRAGKVLLTAQVRARCAELKQMTNLPCRLLPQPVLLGASGRGERQGKELVFLHPGFARHEKGSHLFQDAILQLLTESPDLPVRFVVQWMEPFAMPDGSSVGPTAALREHPRVEFIPRALPLAEYDALLGRTDAMVLPYLASSYYARDSRAAIEASVLGMPAVFTRHTWLEEHFDEYGAGIAVEEDVDSLKAGIRALVESFDAKKTLAVERMEKAKRYYSVENFRGLVIA